MRTPIPLALLLCLSLLGTPASLRAQASRFIIEAPASTIQSAELIALDADGPLYVKDDAGERKIPRLVGIKQVDRDLPAMPTRNFVLLTNGDRIPLDPDASAMLEESRMQVWPAKNWPELKGKGLSLYVPNVVMLFWSLPDGVDDAELYFAQIEQEARARDVLYYKNGDRVEGTLTALSGKEGAVITTDRGKLRIPWSKVAGIAWNTERQVRLRTTKTHWRAALEGGARVNLLDLRFDGKTRRWLGAAQFGLTLDLPESAVLALDSRQGATIDLADLTPTRYAHSPYLGVSWPLMTDRSATGHRLRLSGSTFERGLGTHAACRVEYKVGGKYQRFLSTVGIDESARRGRAVIAIELDGKRIDLNDGKELTSNTAPLAVALDVRNVMSMTLIVERGAFGDVQAHVNWANARLVKND